ncbi:hypothetical protein A6A06_22250 [Streptomyces sp. CB02923]|uniref:hypothetical protein n=1 Tax=Streptomyces sp. CB02923 TaxID=1718985 RepID=UPI00093D0E8D|nr:hypothetical protein [Streptomyces sp. CB02923]OKH99797.1 hypothetical protein A6A06_22250 [Streptomyces sp. CB02923]
MASHAPTHRPQTAYAPDPAPDPAFDEQLDATDRLGDELLDNKTTRQEEVTAEIYEQLHAGSQVDDIKHLIARLSRVAKSDEADRTQGGRAAGGRS